MVGEFVLEVEKREGKGKSVTRKLRAKGYVPAIFYNKKGENIPLTVKTSHFEKLYSKVHKTKVVDLKLKNGEKVETKHALIWDVQRDPVKNFAVHVDFLGVDLTEEVYVEVSVMPVGKAKGEERGGVLNVYREIIPVVCLPTAIPEKIEVDVSSLDINDIIHVKDIKLPEGVRLDDVEDNFAILGVEPPEKETTEEESEEAKQAEEA
ncbi:50S ribosomal protein L25 [Desulfothermus naphthae]